MQKGGWLDELKSTASEYAEDYRNFNLEKEIDNYLNNPQIKARKIATSENEGEDPVDNIRHAQAGRLTGKAIEDKTGNIPYLSKAAGFLGATAAGIGHEVMVPNTDISWYNTIREGAEDIYNNTYGAYQNLLDISDEERSNKIFRASYNNQLPDGYGEGNMYFGPKNSDKKAYGKKANGGWLDSFDDGGKFSLIDNRKVASATGNTLKNNQKKSITGIDPELVNYIIKKSVEEGRDPYTMLAIALQETSLGTAKHSKGDWAFNPFHLNNEDIYFDYRFNKENPKYSQKDVIDMSFDLMNEKDSIADKRGYTDEAMRIQGWNGYGTVTSNSPMYGMSKDQMETYVAEPGYYDPFTSKKVPDKMAYAINMEKDPVYGRQILDMRDNVLKNSPDIVNAVVGYTRQFDTTPDAMPIKGTNQLSAPQTSLPTPQEIETTGPVKQKPSLKDKALHTALSVRDKLNRKTGSRKYKYLYLNGGKIADTDKKFADKKKEIKNIIKSNISDNPTGESAFEGSLISKLTEEADNMYNKDPENVLNNAKNPAFTKIVDYIDTNPGVADKFISDLNIDKDKYLSQQNPLDLNYGSIKEFRTKAGVTKEEISDLLNAADMPWWKQQIVKPFLKDGGWLDSYDDGGHVHPHKDSQYSLPTYSPSVGSEAPRASITPPTEKPRFETEQERFLRENAEAIRFNTPASGRADALYGLEDPIFMAALTGAQTVGAAATGLGAKTLYPYARAIGEELSMGLTEAPNLLYQVGKAGLKGAKRAADSGSQAYKDYLAKPLRKDLEPKQIKKAVIKDKDTKIMDSFKDKPSPDHTDVINLVPDAAKSKQLGMETFSINKGNKNVGEISGERLPNGDFQTMDIGVNPKFQKQGIATEAYKELNKSLPRGNKVTSFGAYVKQADGVAPGKNTWASLERKGLARKNNQGIYEMIPAPDYIDVSKSEIDWGKWNKEIPDNKPLMKEYNAIEQSTKADGTWMKNADGTKFEGTPEQFVQQNSKNFKKAFKNTKVLDEHGNPKIVYHGTRTSDGIKKQGYSKSMSGKGNRGADEGNIYFSDSYKNAEYTGVKADEFEEVFKNVQATQNHFKTKGNFINVPSTDSLNKAARKAEKEMHEFRRAKDHVNGGNKPTIFNKKKVNAELDRLDKLETDAFNRRKSLQEDAHQASMYHSGINYLKGNKNGYYQNPLNLTRRKFNLDEPTKIDQNVKDLVINSAYNTEGLRYSPDVLSNYVNIEKPLVKDFGYKSTDVNPLKAGFVESMGYSNKIEPHLKELAKDDYTGAIQKNLFDVLHGDVYLVKNPNNIKSAVGNNGMFDMSDPNIYKAVTGIATAGALGASATEQKNGGWLDTFHDGGEIGHIHEGNKVMYNTPAYKKAYNEGKIATQGDGYLQAPDLPVFEVNAAEQEKEKMDYITGLKKPYYKPGESVHIRPDFRGGLTSRIGNYAAGSDKFFAREASDITNTGGVSREEKYGPEVYDFYRNYFGLPLKTDAVQISKYRPTNETDPSSIYYSNTSKDLKSDIINIYNTLSPKQKENIKKESSILVDGYSPKSYNTHNWKGLSKEQRNLLKSNRNYSTGIGQFRLGEGEDAEGKYISYYDVFDKATGGTFKGANENLLGAAKPFEIYDRIYLNDFENISKKKNGGWLDTY